MGYTPNLPVGQSTDDGSAPVVLAIEQEAILNEMQAALAALASVKGILSDLRVSVVNTPAVTSTGTSTVTFASNQDMRTVATITNPLARTALDIQVQCNQLAQSFAQNVIRS